jgi:hypothetical protein
MKRLWHAWVELMDRREPATALACVRIAVALVLLADFAQIYALGLVEPLFARAPLGFSAADATIWCHVATVSLVALALGAGTRVACVVYVIASSRLGIAMPEADRGIDMILRIAIAILAFSQCHAKWSVDAWIRARIGRPFAALVPAWPRYLLLLQLVWIYFSGGTNKGGATWGPQGGFTALANALTAPHIARFDPGWVATALPLTRVATALTMAFELGAPLYLLFYYYAKTADRPGRLRAWCNRYRLRWIWIGLGLCFSFGIALGLRLGIFPYGMLALYPVLY